MLGLDECNQVLVTNPFADESSTVSSSDSNNHDTLVTLTLNSSSDHPLRSRPLSLPHRCNTPGIPVTVVGGECETRRRPTSLDRSESAEVVAAGDRTIGSASEAPQGGSDIIIHPVGPSDSFAGVALRYSVSIAALRRANQLWPSDPIHFRTELLIPRGNTLRARHKPIHSSSTDATLRSNVEPTPDFSPDPLTSSFIAARNIILSVLPARISLDSLSSRAGASEDHELDDLPTARAHKMSTVEAPFTEDGHELSIIAAPHTQYSVALSSQFPCSPTGNQDTHLNHISPVRDLRSRSVSTSPTISLERLPHRQPFAVLPVRTSQLEPEPAMELPVRRSRI